MRKRKPAGDSPAQSSPSEAFESPAAVDRIVREPAVREMIGNPSKSTFRRMIDQELFPRPIQLSQHLIGWRLSTVQQWIAKAGGQSASVD